MALERATARAEPLPQGPSAPHNVPHAGSRELSGASRGRLIVINAADSTGYLGPLRPEDPRDVAGYRLVARIGEGGMGAVYLSYTRGNQPVALKVIRREFAQDEEFRRRFQQEVQSARRVQGYHVVPVVDHDTTGSLPWLATTFVPGVSLDEAMAVYGPLPLPSALQLVGCVAEALRAVHVAGVIHRDLKPSNILLGAGGPWLIDFGIARAADATQLTRSGGLIGTPQYMSPEHVNGGSLSPATDVFSLGLVAAVAATGRHPYGNGAAVTLASRIANSEFRPPDLTGYPEPLRPVLERCLAVDPASRPTPAELAELCAEAYGRPLRDFTRWLPNPLTAEIACRAQSSRQPPWPGPPAEVVTSGHLSTYVPRSPQYVPAGSGAPSSTWRQALVVIGAVVAAVVVATMAVSALTGGGDETGGRPSGGPTATSPGQSTQPPASGTSSEPSPTRTASADYAVKFKRKPFTIRPGGWSEVDLDVPKVDSNGAFKAKEETEIQYIDSFAYSTPLVFLTPTGISDGTTPEACKSGAETNVLPPALDRDELTTTIHKGTVLCTVTTEGNLAMLEITKIVERSTYPDYITRLTLWKMP
ncbi:serine/threonine-protein kinase [Streptomyces sp. NPDC093064]|uniref:serine/threonine-protein kinase n=1 Tax=Streptomyces sp. NPDC093064 TaxID=3366020 RepID=UPI0037F60DF7